MVTGTTGNDDITLQGQSGDVTVDLLAGDDILSTTDRWSSVNATATIHGDDGYDTLRVYGDLLSSTGSGFSGQIVTDYFGLILTDNWDGIERVEIIGRDISTSHSFVTGDSDDSLELEASQDHQTISVTTNGGNDHVVLYDKHGDIAGSYFSGTIDLGAGDDSLALGADENSSVADAFHIFGGAGDDVLTDSAGKDTLYGGADDDSYYLRPNQSDIVVELADEGDDTVYIGVSYTLPDNVENLIFNSNLGYANNRTFTGNALDNHIVMIGGGSGTIDGGAGADTMEGGVGSHTYYVDNVGDVVIESGSNDGQNYANGDAVWSSITYTLGDNLERLKLTGSAAIDGTGNGLDNELIGNDAANTLTGLAGNDHLSGKLGGDTLIGGTGDDVYVVDDAGDVIVELAGEGTDRVESYVSYTMNANVENLTIVGPGDLDAIGNALDNEIDGNSDDNFIDGGAGADEMRGGAGDDTYVVDNPLDQVTYEMSRTLQPEAGIDTLYSSISFTLPKNIEIMILTGSANINATGNNIANQIDGNSGNNVIDGSFGADTMRGGAGDDIYYVDNPGDTAYEGSAANGNDTVFSTVSFTLGSAIETLVLLGTGNANATGNNSPNQIVGNSGNNIIDGRMGADTMEGGLGNDTYYVDYSGDVVIEASGAGTDTVRSSYLYHTLAANVENLVLVAGSAARTGTGNNLANVIDGNEFANVLDGMAGADTMRGGNGDDTYYVDNTGDSVVEASATGGNDIVYSSVNFTLGANVETLVLTGTGNTSGSGNSGDNLIQGNSGNNSLDGKVGYDTMEGGLGNDGYYVDSSHDVVIENAGGGTDVVRSSASSYVLAANVENLILIGSAVTGFGNGLDNIIQGNAGDNLINGGAGADTMSGGSGNDTYIVDNVLDVINETSTGLDPAAGNDTVRSSVSYTLSKNVENLVLLSGNIDGMGNSLDNAITGTSGNNILGGGAGNDTLDGGSGLDRFLFDTALNSTTNVDDILNFVVADDTILLDRTIFTQVGPNGTLAASAFRIGGIAQDADDRILYDPGSGNIFYDADGNGAGSALLFAHVTPGLVLTEADFLIVP